MKTKSSRCQAGRRTTEVSVEYLLRVMRTSEESSTPMMWSNSCSMPEDVGREFDPNDVVELMFDAKILEALADRPLIMSL